MSLKTTTYIFFCKLFLDEKHVFGVSKFQFCYEHASIKSNYLQKNNTSSNRIDLKVTHNLKKPVIYVTKKNNNSCDTVINSRLPHLSCYNSNESKGWPVFTASVTHDNPCSPSMLEENPLR